MTIQCPLLSIDVDQSIVNQQMQICITLMDFNRGLAYFHELHHNNGFS